VYRSTWYILKHRLQNLSVSMPLFISQPYLACKSKTYQKIAENRRKYLKIICGEVLLYEMSRHADYYRFPAVAIFFGKNYCRCTTDEHKRNNPRSLAVTATDQPDGGSRDTATRKGLPGGG
jgi:hypothetical protein